MAFFAAPSLASLLEQDPKPREDVLLVQLAFSVIAKMPKPIASAELLEAAKAVQVTGAIDEPTINAIRVLQFERKTSRDRSPMNASIPLNSVAAMVLAFLSTSI